MNGEGWAWPLSSVWGDAAQSLGVSRSQELRLPAQQDRRDPGSSSPNSSGSAEATKAQRGEGTCPRSHSELVGKLGLGPRSPDSQPGAPSISPATQLCQARTP